jgi:hypothetical protein
VAANPFYVYGWHTYQWARWSIPTDWSAEVWVDFTAGLNEMDPESGLWVMLANVEVNIDGLVSILWGDRPEAYDGETGPVAVKAAVPVTIEIFGLPNKTYYVNAKWSGVITYPTGTGLPRASEVQFGEVTA